MRAAALLLLLIASSACSRRVETQTRDIEAPSARGGGPTVESPRDSDARARVVHARCAFRAACGDAEPPDACHARMEADLKLTCAIDPARVDACVEAIRARTCAESSSATTVATINECAESQLCAPTLEGVLR